MHADKTAHPGWRQHSSRTVVTPDVRLLTTLCQNQRRRAFKLAQADLACDRLLVTIRDPARLDAAEKVSLRNNCRRYNLSFYRCIVPCDRQTLTAFWRQLGLTGAIGNPEADDDNISRIETRDDARYIPYTNQALSWHTDGYYNVGARTIRAFAMHCARPAGTGGTNCFFDPEILCMLVHDENPRYLAALTHPRAMTIPANDCHGAQHRRAVSVPMLAYESGRVLFRYTERSNAAHWRDDPVLVQARAYIRATLRRATRYCLTYKLHAHEGVVCNNVLHTRTAFKQATAANTATGRLLYRARFDHAVA